MKTYTIRPLEWKMAAEDVLVAKAAEYEYELGMITKGVYQVALRSVYGEHGVLAITSSEAAAKELAWQDWLRRITPALEEVK